MYMQKKSFYFNTKMIYVIPINATFTKKKKKKKKKIQTKTNPNLFILCLNVQIDHKAVIYFSIWLSGCMHMFCASCNRYQRDIVYCLIIIIISLVHKEVLLCVLSVITFCLVCDLHSSHTDPLLGLFSLISLQKTSLSLSEMCTASFFFSVC